tara:strand:+ start:834 stop:4463 length:3630 start_codon:yes stop_codon:yes gene_type:complete
LGNNIFDTLGPEVIQQPVQGASSIFDTLGPETYQGYNQQFEKDGKLPTTNFVPQSASELYRDQEFKKTLKQNLFDTLGEGREIGQAEQEDGFGYPTIMNELSKFEGDITEEEMIANPVIMQGLREIMKARYSEDTRNNYTMDEKYDNTLDDLGVLDEWQNWNRSLGGGQTVTTANDVAWFVGADEKQKALLGANFEILERMPNIFTGDVAWAETRDGVYDYLKAGIWDPTTPLSLYVGRVMTVAGAKAGGFAMKTAAKEYAKEAARRGLSQQLIKQGQRKILKRGFAKAGAFKAATLPAMMATDATIAVAADRGYQKLRVGSGFQDDYSLPQSVGVALSVMVLPALFAGSKGIVSFTKSKLLENTAFEKYLNVFKLHGNKGPEAIEKAVIGEVDLSKVNANLRGVFQRFKDNIHEFTPYMQARDEAASLVTKKDIAGNPTMLEDFFEVSLMLDKDGGFVKSMQEAGFVYVPREKDDNISKFLGDALKYLDDGLVKEYKDAFVSQFGKLPDAISKIKTAEDLSAWYINRGRFAGKTLWDRKEAARILNKNSDDLTVEDMLGTALNVRDRNKPVASAADRIKYMQSIWKRLVTTHPSTVGLNVKGWAYTAGMNTASDIVLSGLLLGTGKFKKAKGTLLGAARRGVNVMTPQATIEAAENFFRFRPDVAEKLFAERAGGVDSAKILERLNLDPKSKINQLTEKSLSSLQAIVGVKMQDEVTKMLSFYSSFDQNIMSYYGMTHNQFMKQEGAFSKLFSKEFLENVQEPAIARANRETYSTSFANKEGSNIYLYMAKQIEKISNSAGGGMLIPFGRFFNAATATLGDYTGFNALRHLTFRTSKIKNPFDEEGLTHLSKGLVGWGFIYGKLPDGTSNKDRAVEKVRKGIPWNKNQRDDGSLTDETYEFPGGYVEILSQAAAHAEIDGTIPKALREEMGKILISQSFRDSGAAYDTLKDLFITYSELDTDKSIKKSLEVLASSFSRIASGATRPLEPLNTVAQFVTEDFSQPDRRQDNKLYNNSIRYVDKMFGLNLDLPKREKTTRGKGNEFVDVGRTIGGVRSSAPLTPSERLLGSVGAQAWQAVRWGGTPEYKNRLDGLVSDILNYESSLYIEDGILNKSLSEREEAVKRVKKRATNRTKEVLASSLAYDDQVLILQSKVAGKNKAYINEALKIAGYTKSIGELIDEEGAKEKLEFILYLIDNRDAIFFKDLKD